MGAGCPPYYGKADVKSINERIEKIDEKINELFIERAEYVKTLKEAIEG